MNIEQAKQTLRQFTGKQILTFSVNRFEDGAWIANCDQIPAITTCGDFSDEKEMENLMKDAVLTAAGVEVDAEFVDELLYDATVKKDIGVTA